MALGVVAAGGGFDGKANRERKRPELGAESGAESESQDAKPQAAGRSPTNTLRDDVETEAAARAAATFQIPERDLAEAQQLLRLSRLEGRDPLQDAVAGRLALDRLDAIADSDRDTAQAQWADQLRRELKERFNEIAPTQL